MEDTIGMKIAKARGYNLMTQPDLAKHLGVTVQTISNWEHDRRMPDADSIRQLCMLMNVSSDWVLGLSEDMSRKEPNV